MSASNGRGLINNFRGSINNNFILTSTLRLCCAHFLLLQRDLHRSLLVFRFDGPETTCRDASLYYRVLWQGSIARLNTLQTRLEALTNWWPRVPSGLTMGSLLFESYCPALENSYPSDIDAQALRVHLHVDVAAFDVLRNGYFNHHVAGALRPGRLGS